MISGRGLRFVLCALALFLVDFFSKSYVHHHLPLINFVFEGYPYGGIAVFKDFFGVNFSIIHAINKGAAWGMFSSFPDLLLYFRIAVVSGLIGHLLFFNKDKSRALPLILIITGALGNIVDAFVYGYVVDMFYFTFGKYSYPIFNVADTCIFCGVSLLLLKSFFASKSVADSTAASSIKKVH